MGDKTIINQPFGDGLMVYTCLYHLFIVNLEVVYYYYYYYYCYFFNQHYIDHCQMMISPRRSSRQAAAKQFLDPKPSAHRCRKWRLPWAARAGEGWKSSEGAVGWKIGILMGILMGFNGI